MTRRNDVIEIGNIYRPRIEEGVRRLNREQRGILRGRVLAAELRLAESSRSPGERIQNAQRELEALSSLGPTWATLAAQIGEQAQGQRVGQRELNIASLILGLVLKALASAQTTEEAA